MQKKIIRGFVSIFSANVGNLVLALLITPILVRLLGDSQYGKYAFVLSLLGMVTILLNSGIGDGLRKLVAENPSDPAWGNNVFGFSVRLGFLMSIFVITILLSANLLGYTENYIGSEFVSYLYLISILLLGRQLLAIIRSSLMGKGMEHISEPLKNIQKFIFGVVGLSLAYFGFGVSGVLLGHIIGTAIAVCIGLYFVSIHYDILSVMRATGENFPRIRVVSFASLTVPFIFLNSSLYHADILLLQLFSGSTKTGHYKAALIIAEFLWFVPRSIQTALLHSTSEIWNNQNQTVITDIAAKATRFTLLITLLAAMGIAVLADTLVPLYFGSSFTPAITPLLLLLPGALGFAMARPIFAIGQGKGELRILITATGVAAVINLVLNLLLIPSHGMVGAATATSLSYGSMLAFHGIAARLIGYEPFVDLRLPQIIFTATFSASILLGIEYIVSSRLLQIVVIPSVGFFVYVITALQTGAVDPEEISPILNWIPSSVVRWVK